MMTHNTPNLSERELLNDILATEKQLLHAYSTYIAEATCPNLRQELNRIISDTQQIQFDVYNAMQQKGWYNVKNAQLQDVQQTVQTFQQVQTQLS
jgi:spore coat protein F